MRMQVSAALFALVLLPTLAAASTPNGWFLAGSDPRSYRIERDTSVVRDGKASGLLASTAPPKGFGTMMQSFDPGEYLGKRLRLSAWVKAKDVKSWAGVWMRVDAKDKMSIAFDNMQSRPIQGTRDWKRYDIVLDVADNASGISFGILMEGEGKVWLNDLQFEIVDASVPVTSTYPSSQLKKPTNLDFGN